MNYLYRIIVSIFILVVTANELYSQDSTFMKESMAEFDLMYGQILKEREEFNSQVMSKWGDEEVVESEKTLWVEYNDDQNSRSIVDFESGDIRVEVLLSEADFKEGLSGKKLSDAVEKMLSSNGRDSESESLSDGTESFSPILDRQIDLSSYGIDLSAALMPVDIQKRAAPPMPNVGSQHNLAPRARDERTPAINTQTTQSSEIFAGQQTQSETSIAEAQPSLSSEKEIKIVAEAIVQKTESEISEIIDAKGEKKVVVALNLKLVEDHVSVRASKFSKIISAQSGRFSVAEPIIYAIMEQESSFLETAKSGAPAYGLMQLVPKSGGLEAYRYVYKKDKIVSASYLYNPQNNVELGVALIKVLMTRYFAKVTDERCRLLCSIAAYNCGSGNVSKAIINSTNLPKAIPEINKMNYDELYAFLYKRLLVVIGGKETSEYIEKVTKNIYKYSNQTL